MSDEVTKATLLQQLIQQFGSRFSKQTKLKLKSLIMAPRLNAGSRPNMQVQRQRKVACYFAGEQQTDEVMPGKLPSRG